MDVPGGSVRADAKAWGVSKSTAARWITRGADTCAHNSLDQLGELRGCDSFSDSSEVWLWGRIPILSQTAAD
jgi:hypothetical protein